MLDIAQKCPQKAKKYATLACELRLRKAPLDFETGLENISTLSPVESQGALAFHAATQPYPLRLPIIQFTMTGYDR